MFKVKHLMSHQVTPLTMETCLTDAVDQLLSSGFLGLPVVDEKKQLVGFLSEQDCIKALITDSYHCDSHIQVKDIMHKNPLFVSAELSILELATIMGKDKPKIFPVVDDFNRIVGIITRSQVMSSLNQSLKGCRVA
ncbi:CBS domain-containing protein [Neptunomonas phycophila]|jgi:predicted transcriptional regulator|uniref:CBS domain-containing protein n=1 Tax=Neptunomonas TaxID=75687 RepID=UPI000948D4A2|nr:MULTISPECIES: CBS domain-containing protein [Neptunomonas]MBT3145711.1 CBS domain-containing protein [Neptunomonas phycophila]MDN2660204.1 CBS domain-containing protein [Neptunomonas sp. CHC150]MDO6469338.1 CBS domain-containing protein [Neptunomonas phycophila]MDO6784328.1 CBS domain-containing protein [Neptunomonas phycophila]QLE99245.1 CBS domain-containing protein [Neptunomonas phycophila]